jgi:hypothetical protein
MPLNYHLPFSSSIPLEKAPLPLCGGGAFQGSLTSLGKHCEITVPPPVDKAAISRRLERFELQSLASEILEPFKRVRKNGDLYSPSVCDCLRKPRKKYVEIWKSVKHGRHYYAGLVTCGSVWDCLPCAAKISEFRGNEIKQGVEACQDRGGSVVMLTQTFPHYENQKCKPLFDKFSKARQTMKNRKPWRGLVSGLGMIGNINRTEVTYGKNGWHIHCHTLLFFSGLVTLSPGQIFPMWESACVASGLPSPSKAHGVKISSPKQMADYIAKQGKETSNWTIEAEMTKGHTKRGGLEGMTPFDLLRSFRDTKNDTHKRLFAEYSQTFKGKRQLVWSKGLRGLLLLAPEITDEEIVEQHDELDELFVMIETAKLWPLIRKLKMRGQLLEAANLGEEKFTAFLRYLQTLGGYVELPF